MQLVRQTILHDVRYVQDAHGQRRGRGGGTEGYGRSPLHIYGQALRPSDLQSDRHLPKINVVLMFTA